MSQIKRGALIVFEGVDKSGKTTHCRRLVEALEKNNVKTKLIVFPDRSTATGKLIDDYLKNKECKLNDHAIHLLFSANRWENVDKMQALLKDGVTLIVDRYSYSGIAYSAIKKNMDPTWCKNPEIGLPKPDLVFLLTINKEEMMLRPGFGSERYEDSEIQRKVSEMYQQMCKENDNWININTGRAIEEVHDQLFEKCIEKIGAVEYMPIGTLDFSTYKKVSNTQNGAMNGTAKS